MSNLTNQYISSSYLGVLNLADSTNPITSTLQAVQDGLGNNTAISIATQGMAITGSLQMSGSIIPGRNNTYDLGSPTEQFRHLYVSSGSVWMDNHQILSLGNDAQDTTIAAPPSGSLTLLNDVLFSAEYGNGFQGGGRFTMAGGGISNSTQTHYSGSYHYIQSNGEYNVSNKLADSEGNPLPGTGSIHFNVEDESVLRHLIRNNSTYRVDAVESDIYHFVEHNSNNSGSIKFQINQDGVGQPKSDLWLAGGNLTAHGHNGNAGLGLGSLGVVIGNNFNGEPGTAQEIYFRNNQIDINGNTTLTGSLYQSGTFYADNLSFANSPSIQSNTGSYVMTYLGDGTVAYADYPTFGEAVSPYITGGSGSAGTSGTSGQAGSAGSAGTSGTSGTSSSINTGSFATTGSNNFTGQQVIGNPNGFQVNDTGHSSAYLNFNFYTGGTQSQANFNSTADSTYIQSKGNMVLSTGLAGGTGSLQLSGKNINITSFNGLNYTGTTNLYGNQYISGALFMTGSSKYNTPSFPAIHLSGKNSTGIDYISTDINSYGMTVSRSGSAVQGDYTASYTYNAFSVYDNTYGNGSYMGLGQVEVGGGNPTNGSSGNQLGLISDFNYIFGDGQDSPALYTYDNNGTPIALIYTQAADGWTDGAVSFNVPVNITGSLVINSGSLNMNGITGSNNAIVFPFIVGTDVQTPSKIYQNNNGDIVTSPNNNAVIAGNSNIYLPGLGYPGITFGQDSDGNFTNMTFGGINQAISGSMMVPSNGFVQNFIQDTDSGNVIGFAMSAYNTNDGSLSANFYGPGTGSNIVGGNNDNTIFAIPITGSTLTIYRDTVVSGSLVTTAGFAQETLITDQELSSGVDTTITFNNSNYDPSGWYNSEYFYYQPTVAGVYQVSYSVTWLPAISGTGQVNVQVHKNDGATQVSINQQQLNLIDNLTQTGTVFVDMNGSTDTLSLTAYTSCTAGQTINGGNGTYFNIKLV